MAKRILVVDANQQVGTATARVLGDAGYASKAVTTFQEALDEVGRECPDLLVTAVRLGHYNGLHLAFRCHEQHPELPVLVMGVGSDAKLADESRLFDVKFVMRPATYPDVLRLVRESLGEGSAANGDVPIVDARDRGDRKSTS